MNASFLLTRDIRPKIVAVQVQLDGLLPMVAQRQHGHRAYEEGR
jgi:hypothetical protein